MKIGILGTGKMANIMASTLFHMKDIKRYAVASRTLEKAQKFADKWNFLKVYGSYEELLKNPEIDLIYIATPHSHHYEHIKLCLEYNKNILCEKAFTVNSRQAKELFVLAQEKHIFIAEAIWTRYLPMRQTLTQVLKSNIIGKPQFITANICYPIHIIPRLRKPSLAGGTLLDIGIYALNFTAMIFEDSPLSISGYATLTNRNIDVQENITLSWEDGRMACLQASMMGPSNNLGTIVGTCGYIEVLNINNPKEIRIYNSENNLIEIHKCPEQITGYEYEILSCAHSIENALLECPEMPHSETLRMLEWMDKLRSQFGVTYPME